MNRRATGTIFCLIAAILYATRYLSAAIFMSGISSWSNNLFTSGLNYVGGTLTTFSTISLVVGIAYLVLAEFEEFKK